MVLGPLCPLVSSDELELLSELLDELDELELLDELDELELLDELDELELLELESSEKSLCQRNCLRPASCSLMMFP